MAQLERQAVQGLQQVRSAGLPSVRGAPVPTAGDVELSRNPSTFVQDLLTAAGNVAKVGTEVMAQAVEEDKVRQVDRALNGLMPTQDATTGGKRASMLVKMQNEIALQSAKLKENANRWEGTDEAWEDHVVMSRQSVEDKMLMQYPELIEDKDTRKAITNAFIEQQPQIVAARASAKIAKDWQDRTTAMNSRIVATTQGLSGAELVGTMEQLKQEAVALQLSVPEFESMFASVAMERAAVGDTSLIDATKDLKDHNGVSLYDRNGKLQTSAIQGQRMWASLNQSEVAEQKWQLEQRYMSGELDDAQLLVEAHQQNLATGASSWSDEAINTLRRSKAKKSGADGKLTQALMNINSGKLLVVDDYTEKELKGIEKAAHSKTDAEVEAYAKIAGLNEEQTEELHRRETAKTMVALAKAGIKDTTMSRQVGGMMNLSPEHLKDMTQEPPELENLLRKWDSLPDEYRTAIVGEKEGAFITNYQRALDANMNVGQAIDFAQKAGRNVRLNNKDVTKGAESVAKSVASASGWNPFNNFPDYIKEQMKNVAGDYMRTFMTAGYSKDDAEKQTELALQREYSQHGGSMFTGGTVIKGGVDKLAQKYKVNPQDIGLVLQSYLEKNKQTLADAAGVDNVDEMYFDIDQRRGIYTVRNGTSGMPVQAAKPLAELMDYKWAEDVANMPDQEKTDMIRRVESNALMAQGRGGTSLMNMLFPDAKASMGTPPANFEIGNSQKQAAFVDYIATAENSTMAGYDTQAGTFVPYDSDVGTQGEDTIAYGHKLTPEEKANGYILIGGEAVPYKQGSSQLTDQLARHLLEQDLEKHVPSTSGWKIPYDQLHPSAKRALVDTAYNMGKNFLNKAPKAKAAFEAGDLGSGFVYMLDAVNEGGKRSTGLLARRAQAYNLMADGGDALPRIDKVQANEDGSMRVKFASRPETMLRPDILAKIDKDGWYTVVPTKAGSLHSRSKAGTIDV